MRVSALRQSIAFLRVRSSKAAGGRAGEGLVGWMGCACLSLALLVGCGQSHGPASSPDEASPPAATDDQSLQAEPAAGTDGDDPDTVPSPDAASGRSDAPSGIPCGPNVCGEGE